MIAELLSAVHILVGSRFFMPVNTLAKTIALADPLVTSSRVDQIIEKKVTLPLRWVHGILEVQSYQA